MMAIYDNREKFWSTYKSKISTVDVLDNQNIDAVESWDVSEKQDKSVMAWIINDSDNSGMYKLYIGGDEGVSLKDRPGSPFSGLKNAISMNLSNLDTSKVVDMSYMFNYCENLTSLDLSSFDTSNVTTMSYMFQECTSLTKLNLCSFDTNKVTHMDFMFDGTSNLKQVNVGSKWTTANAITSNMFSSSGVSSVTTGKC